MEECRHVSFARGFFVFIQLLLKLGYALDVMSAVAHSKTLGSRTRRNSQIRCASVLVSCITE